MANDPAYHPIEDYGVIGDLNTVALVALNGSIDFMCFPDFDSPTIFATLLDKDKGGFFRIHPQAGEFKNKQLYLPDTNILLTRFLSADGIGELTDCMPVQELNRGNEIIRRVTTIQGKITYKMSCLPRFDYARASHKSEQINSHEVIFSCKQLKMQLRLKSTVDMHVHEQDGYAEFTLECGQTADFMLLLVDKQTPEREDMSQFITNSLKENMAYWKSWIAQCKYTGRWMEMVKRSALSLKLMTSYKYGSLVAAPTFGLPEVIGGNRNWDYRYTWIRDASFSVYCLLNLGYSKEAGNFINWVEHKCLDIKGQENIQLMYRLDGSKNIEEKELKHLAGYKDSKPVLTGNAAYQQIQLDIYGELMDAVCHYDMYVEPISYQFWLDLSRQINWLTKNWEKKDDGIWEVRGGKKNFLYSKLMCWVALDRAIKIAQHHSYPLSPEWITARDKIFHIIHEKYYDKKIQSFVQYEGSDAVDAASLLMPIIGFIGHKDPKWLNTLQAIEENLISDFLVYRYKNEGDDYFQGKEGTFSMCTFWYIECLCLSGQLEKATLYFEKMLGFANHLGLYAEELGFSGEHLGNYPQAFTHLGLIRAAIKLDKELNNARNRKLD